MQTYEFGLDFLAIFTWIQWDTTDIPKDYLDEDNGSFEWRKDSVANTWHIQ